MKLPKNTVFEWLNDESEVAPLERILDYLPGGKVVTIRLDNPKSNPTIQAASEIARALADGEIRVLDIDPYSKKNQPEDEIQENNRRRREEAWNLIRPIVDAPAAQVFNKSRRWKAIKSQNTATGKPFKVIYSALHKYWVGGQIKNALLPDYKRTEWVSGGRRGRKGGGLTLDPEHIKKFELGIKAFYDKETKPSLRSAYHKTLARYFNSGYCLVNGETVPQLPPAHLLPSERQFRYWFKVYPTFDVVALFFGMSQPQACVWAHRLAPVLERTLKQKLALPARKPLSSILQTLEVFPSLTFIVDGTERPVSRPKNGMNRKACYSGRKKRYAVKNILAVRGRRIVALSHTRPGRWHDKKCIDTEKWVFPRGSTVLGDRGFSGYTQPFAEVRTPKRRPNHGRTPKTERPFTKRLSRRRIAVEHAIAGVKRSRICSDILRTRKRGLPDKVMLIGCALHNFRVDSRMSA